MAIVVVEHDMNSVMGVCDQLVVLDFGTLIASGPPDTVRSDPVVVAAYLGEDDDNAPDDATDRSPAESPAAASVAGGAS
jgi:branched-chain amino acid transport system ATP-binding protein